jgi:hypothetical protein
MSHFNIETASEKLMFKNISEKLALNNLNKSFFSIYFICILGFTITVASNFPGLMTPDSDFQLLQATSFSFTDWHPPIMSIIWSVLLQVADGPIGMLLLFCTLYWLSFALMAKSLSKRSIQASTLLLTLSFCPFSINFAGTIWKDVFVFVFFLFGLSFIIRSHFDEVPISKRTSVFLIVIFTTGALARHNAIFTGIVLSILCLTYTKDGRIKNFSAFILTTIKATILFSSVFAGMFFAIDHFAKPEKKYASSSLFVYDLVGISIRSNEYLLPKSESFDIESIKTCYENKGWDKIWVSCPSLIDELNVNGEWNKLSGYWALAIKKYPKLYFKHRTYYFMSFFNPAWLIFNSDPTKINNNFGFKRTALFSAMESYVKIAASAPVINIFFTNGFWVLLNLFMVVYSFIKSCKKFEQNNICLLLIALSGLAYSGPLLIGGVAPDFRYIYWSIGSSIVYASMALAVTTERKNT